MPDADIRGQRPERHDRIEAGEHRVAPIVRKRIGVEHHARVNDDHPRHRHIQCRRSGTIIDFRRTRERNLRVRHALLNRLERTGKIHRQQHDVEAVNTENIGTFIPVAFQIARHGGKIRQRREHHPRAQQPLVERICQEEHQAETRPCDGRHIVHAQRPLTQLHIIALLMPRVHNTEEFADDQQTAIRPTPPLHHQRTEIRRGGTIAQPLRIVDQMPAEITQIDTGFGVFDHRAILNIRFHRARALSRHHADIVERGLADHRVRTYPERGVIVGHALMQHVLNVGGGGRDAFDSRRRATIRGIRGLDHGHALIAGLFHLVHQAQAVVAQQHGIGVQRQHVFGIAHHEIGRFSLAHVTQNHPVRRFHALERVPHQSDERIQIHGFVAFTGGRRIQLAFERPSFCGENAYQTFVQLQNAIRVDMLLQGDRFVQRLFRQTQVACKTAQYLVAEEIVGMIFDQPCVGLMLQPLRGRTIVFRTACDHTTPCVHLIGERRNGFVARFGETFRRCRQFGQYFRHEFAACFENRSRFVIVRMRRIVD